MSSQKKYPATARKKRKAREQGDVVKSRDTTGAIIFLAFLIELNFSHEFVQRIDQFAQSIFASKIDLCTAANALYLMGRFILLPFLLIFFAALIGEQMQVGFILNLGKLSPDFKRLNPFSGLKRIFGFPEKEGDSMRFGEKAYEVMRILVLLFAMIIVFFVLFVKFFPDILSAYYLRDINWLLLVGQNAWRGLMSVFMLIFVLAAIVELLMVRKRQAQRLMMTEVEMKREFRESEGSQEIKGMRKNLHHELLKQALIQGVRRAKVVVSN